MRVAMTVETSFRHVSIVDTPKRLAAHSNKLRCRLTTVLKLQCCVHRRFVACDCLNLAELNPATIWCNILVMMNA